MIEEFVAETGSAYGKNILDNFEDYIGKFWLVKPKAAELETLLEDDTFPERLDETGFVEMSTTQSIGEVAEQALQQIRKRNA